MSISGYVRCFKAIDFDNSLISFQSTLISDSDILSAAKKVGVSVAADIII